jgi:hypothetical protein
MLGLTSDDSEPHVIGISEHLARIAGDSIIKK